MAPTPPHSPLAPPLTFPARGALPAALMLVKLDEASNSFNDVGLGREGGEGESPAAARARPGRGLVPYRFVHDNDGGCAKPALRLHQGIEVHQHGLTH